MTAPITCPHCSSTMPATARFCPGCGEPRSAVRQELERASAATGVPYERLLEQARSGIVPSQALSTSAATLSPVATHAGLSGYKKFWITLAVCVVMTFVAVGMDKAEALILAIPILVFVFVKYL